MLLLSHVKLLDDALEAVRNLPPDDQDSIARVVLRLPGMDDVPPVVLSTDERAAIAVSKAGARAVNSPVTSKCGRHGPNTACEASLHPSGTRRP